MLFLHLLLQMLNDLLRCMDTDISHNQNLLDLLIEIIIDTGESTEYIIDTFYNVVSRLGQALYESAKKSLFLLCRLFLFHCLSPIRRGLLRSD